ncbi:hypothetical protein A3A46_01115 [Candidatus Roizmanbacteria bacterium RIFCSPLOWO2_01_FULL_37_13]|uniref:PIN domain-containing protein n=1 Tax=Candidatus Roizmanbacteria bacterium RIFCSPHIGHO2_02_FULL_38_11 TaxID=1802039 RepID=A0A1F7GZZ3_9BACT|nr:MAG: hypothetical protein A3C25_06050 [Candidatus Roizmanbacteria bacterium RIFCSPHIGHO2_02_FULL_38_11]OGK41540.1 MAG: hypothetical protein A3A46_01115 [Candidatus Roizmanbacteria bacterium RIFCSPLOWO2_01_FULL_37_13]
MSQCYLDANFLVFLKNENAPQHREVLTKLANLIKRKVYIFVSPLVIDEFIHAMLFSVKRRAKFDKEIFNLKNALKEILDLPFLRIIGTPIDSNSQLMILDIMIKYDLKPRDSYHLLIMLANSIDTFATFDTDFKKVFASKLILPLD